MTTIERKVLVQTVVLGAVLTGLVLVADTAGGLAPLERWVYDARAAHCQWFTPPPTDRIVHLDITDAALEAIGRWPWNRSTIAEIVDELHRGGAEVIALDVLLAEPSEPELVRRGGELLEVDHDQILADTIEQVEHMILPVHFEIRRPWDEQERALYQALRDDLELVPAAAFARAPGKPDEDLFLASRRKAMYDAVEAALDDGLEQEPAIRARLLPKQSERGVTGSPLIRLLDRQLQKARAVRSLRRFAQPAGDQTPDVVPVEDALPPIPVLSRAAKQTAFVTYPRERDGVLRSVPLWFNHRGWLYPQMGVALACELLGVDPRSLEVEADRLVIPRDDGQTTVIPARRVWSDRAKRPVAAIMDIPWFGPPNRWPVMYDPPDYEESRQHLSVVAVWEVRELARRIVRNNRNADDAIKAVWELADPSRLEKLEADAPPYEDAQAWQTRIEQTLADVPAGWVETFDQMSEAEIGELSNKEQIFYRSVKILPEIKRQNDDLADDLAQGRQSLRRQLSGRAVLMGWAATASVADIVPTSLHGQCPGVVVHGVIFNAIMTGELWWRLPGWVSVVITLVLGLGATLLTGLLSPGRALAGALVLGGGFLLVNAVGVFDYGNGVLAAAPTLLAVVAVWSGGTVLRFVVERAEKARITNRFQSYVDPALVNYVIEHPDEARLDGQERELTVVFTDIAGFTTLSERLRERTVPLLNEYMSQMVPVIRAHEGFVNKFLGDGIMFFYGAPEEDPDHAPHAVSTALRMQQLMGPFNDNLRAQDLPTVSKRVGIATGHMIVGDAGSPDASDYTVLGDTVNLGARLESANKATGTEILINDRTAELCGDRFLLRPVGRLQVVGKTEGIGTFEPLGEREDATDQQRELAGRTTEMVDAYQAGRFEDCLEAADRLDAECGEGKLADLYRRLARRWLEEGAGDDFQGQIVLESK